MTIKTLTATEAGVAIGDVFYSSWGYDQTNVNYFEVVAITANGKSAKLIEIGSHRVDDSHVEPAKGSYKDAGYGWCKNCRKCESSHYREWDEMTETYGVGKCLSDEDAEGRMTELGTTYETTGPKTETKRIQGYTNRDGDVTVYFAWTSYASLHRYEGGSNYETPFGFGH